MADSINKSGKLSDKQQEQALELISGAMEGAQTYPLAGIFTTTAGSSVGVIAVPLAVALNGAGLSCTLGPGLYAYGKDDDGFYTFDDITLIKTPDPANGAPRNDPYPNVDTVWEIGTIDRVHMTLNDGTDEAVSFTRVLSAIAITRAKADGRKDDELLLEALFHLLELEGRPLRVLDKARERRSAPMVMRAGKRFTQGMSASSKRGTFDHENGGAFVMAGDLMISADRAEALSLTVGEKKILAYLNHLATTSGYGYEAARNCIVRTTVDEILEKRGLEPTRKNRERARRDIRTLARQAWEFTDTKTGEWVRVPLAGGAVQIRRGGAVEFTISADYMRLVLNPRAGLLPMDPLLLQTDDKHNPHSYLIGYKLTTHAYQNYGKANQCTLSVRRLLEYVDTIPRPEEVTAQNYTQKIIGPMERDLDALVACGVLEWWDYTHAKGAPLTDAEQAQRLGTDGEDRALPYDVAVKANIQWQFSHDYAEHMAGVMEAREKKRAEALAARQQKEDRDKRMQRRKERRIADKLADKELAGMEHAGADRVESAPSK